MALGFVRRVGLAGLCALALATPVTAESRPASYCPTDCGYPAVLQCTTAPVSNAQGGRAWSKYFDPKRRAGAFYDKRLDEPAFVPIAGEKDRDQEHMVSIPELDVAAFVRLHVGERISARILIDEHASVGDATPDRAFDLDIGYVDGYRFFDKILPGIIADAKGQPDALPFVYDRLTATRMVDSGKQYSPIASRDAVTVQDQLDLKGAALRLKTAMCEPRE